MTAFSSLLTSSGRYCISRSISSAAAAWAFAASSAA